MYIYSESDSVVFKYSAWSDSFVDPIDRVVLYLCAEQDQIKINAIFKSMSRNLCFNRKIRHVYCLLV